MNWYLKAFQKYLDFHGRARRSEYWMFVLYNLNFSVFAMCLDVLFDTCIAKLPFGFIYLIYSIIAFIPSLAVTVRRLHDVGKSGWIIFISFVPFGGAIWLFVLLLLDGDREENEYGEDSKISSGNLDNSNVDSTILFALIWIFINKIIFGILPKLIENYDVVWWYKSFGAAMGTIGVVIPLSLAAVVKDKTKRIVLLVFAVLYFIYNICELLTPFINYSRFSF